MKDKLKKIGFLAFSLFFFCFCAFFSLGMLIPGASEAAEGAEMPALYKDGRISDGFGDDFETWFSKRFAYRGQVVDLFSALRAEVFQTGNDQVIVGKEDFLFFEETLPVYEGTDPLTEGELSEIVASLSTMSAYAEARGATLLFVCAPNKNTIYGEYMPDRYHKNEKPGDLDRLYARLKEEGVAYCDLRPALLSAKEEGLLYHKRDTHWNGLGAYRAYLCVMEALGYPAADFPSERLSTHTFEGDLDRLLYPGQVRYDNNTQVNTEGMYIYTSAFATAMDLQITTRGGGEGKLLMFRDSFANALIDLFAASFGSARFERANPYRLDLLNTEKADVVIIEIAERNLRDLMEAADRITTDAG